MKILLCLNNDIQSNVALNLLLPTIQNHQVRVLLSNQVGGNQSSKPALLKSLAFLEQDFITHLFFPLLESRNSDGPFLSFKQLAEKYQIPIEFINNINDPASLSDLEHYAPDLIVSIRHGKIFKKPLIDLPKYGVINLHSGILPNYRGVLATFRALLNGDQTIGTTLHTIADPSIDTGDIIGFTELRVDPARSFMWHTIELYHDGVQLIKDAIHHIEHKIPLNKTPQAHDAGNYYSFPQEQDLQAFIEQGWKLFDMKEYLDFLSQKYCPL